MASAWDCDPEAKTILQALNKTNQKLDLNNLAQSYHLDGSIANSGDGTPLLAAAATAAMVSDDADFRAASWNALVNTPSRGYFSDSMRLFGLFVASGSFVNPLQLTSATPAAPATAPKTYGMSGTDVQAIASTSMTATASVNVATPVNGAIVDLEVYDARGNRVAQKFYENQNLSTVPASYSVSFTPANSGTYTLRGGIFTRDWSNNIAWNNSVSIINVSAAAPAPLPANPTPVTPAPPVRPANVSIWWPGNSQAVAGVQPFKAVLDGVSLNNYSMYWQVDGGSLNLLNDSNVDAPHKESLVDLSHWNWRSNRQYTINFVAMNNSGVIIGQKATVITVGY